MNSTDTDDRAVKRALKGVILRTAKLLRKAKNIKAEELGKLAAVSNAYRRLCMKQEQPRPVTWGECLENPELEGQYWEQNENENSEA